MFGIPILSAILLAPTIAVLLTVLIPGRNHGAIKLVNAVAALITMILSGIVWADYDMAAGGFQFMEEVPWVPDFGIQYLVGVDGFAVVLTMLTALVYLTGVLSMWHLTTETRAKEYFAFMSLLVVGVFGVFVSLDLFAFFFFYEIAVLPMYPLIIIWGSSQREYAGMKLMIFLMGGSALLFPALTALFWVAGGESWSMLEIAKANIDVQTQVFLYPFLYIGFGILAGMFPFHSWSPAGHVAAPTAVSMLHAGVLMKLGAFGILRIAMTLLPEGAQAWMWEFAVLATFNIVYGAFVAMRQTDFKFVIGFSSVSHMGIVLLGLNTLGVDGTNGAVFQMFAHGVMTALFFSSVGFLYEQTHDRDIRNFGGLVRQVPVATAFFICAGLCGIGVPGFASFWAELLVFINAVQVFPVLGILAVAGLIFTAAYMLRVFGKAMFGPVNEKWDHLVEPTPFEIIPRAMLLIVLLGFGLYPKPILDMLAPATQTFLALFN